MSSINIVRGVQSVFALSSTTFKLAASAVSKSISLGTNAIKVYQSVNRSATETINNLQPTVTIRQQALAIQQQARHGSKKAFLG
jgi:hypothetical protein